MLLLHNQRSHLRWIRHLPWIPTDCLLSRRHGRFPPEWCSVTDTGGLSVLIETAAPTNPIPDKRKIIPESQRPYVWIQVVCERKMEWDLLQTRWYLTSLDRSRNDTIYPNPMPKKCSVIRIVKNKTKQKNFQFWPVCSQVLFEKWENLYGTCRWSALNFYVIDHWVERECSWPFSYRHAAGVRYQTGISHVRVSKHYIGDPTPPRTCGWRKWHIT